MNPLTQEKALEAQLLAFREGKASSLPSSLVRFNHMGNRYELTPLGKHLRRLALENRELRGER